MEELADLKDESRALPPHQGEDFFSSERARMQQSREKERIALPTSPLVRRLTLDDLAGQVRVERLALERLTQLRTYAQNLCLYVAKGARLGRVQQHTRAALVDHFDTGERAVFAEGFNAVQNLRDGFLDALTERHYVATNVRPDDDLNRPPRTNLGLSEQLTQRSRAELLDLLRLVRIDAGFLSDRLRALSPTQIELLSSTLDRPAGRETSVTPPFRPKTSFAAARHSLAFSNAVKDQIYGLERKDVISIFLFNVYAANHTQDSAEAERRLHTWSSTCATLYSASNENFKPLICRILHEFANLSEWRARPRLELFLRDVLQKGAFLLGISKPEPEANEVGGGPEASLFTSEAEKFFDQALTDLFSILDDAEGGFPRGALELGSAILGKLDPKLQPQFRGLLLYTWFFSDFLFSFIFRPETHGALLDHHIQRSARKDILYQIADRADNVVWGAFQSSSPASSLARTLRSRVESMNNSLVAIVLPEINVSPASGTQTSLPPLTLTPPDLVTIIDALYPRYTSSSLQDPFFPTEYAPHNNDGSSLPTSFTSSPTSTASFLYENIPFHTKARPTRGITDLNIRYSRFEQLRKDLEALHEASPSSNLELLQNEWIWVQIRHDGKLGWASSDGENLWGPSDAQRRGIAFSTRRKNLTEHAALRLTERITSPPASTASSVGFDRFVRSAPSLEVHFEDQIGLYRSKSDSSNAHFWWKALRHMREAYPVCCLSKNDTRILEPLIAESQSICHEANEVIMALERQIADLQEASVQVRRKVDELGLQLNQLRNKMWYLTGVRDSQPFENARNVAIALNNMCLPESPRSSMESSFRGRVHSRPSSSSLLQQAEAQTTDLMKAPPENGGPKKLADDQIERTLKWLENSKIDNFCPGEERFHRFCLEIKETVSRLVGENMLEGRFLWSSELFSRERVRLDILTSRSVSGQSATRPPSVVSDEGPSLSHGFRAAPQFDIHQSPARKSSNHSFDRWRGGREPIMFDAASTIDSPGRTVSTVTSESVGAFWSPAVTQAQSATSIYSSHSRPSSVHNDFQGSIKSSEATSTARTEFLQEVKDSLLSLLLSDLCCPVWSTGCETDAWLSTALAQQRIRQPIEKRASIERLLSSPGPVLPDPSRAAITPRLKSKRSMSAGPDPSYSRHRSLLTPTRGPKATVDDIEHSSNALPSEDHFSFGMAFTEIIQRLSAQAQPKLKLRELQDLRTLVLESLEAPTSNIAPSTSHRRSHSRHHVRRTSQPSTSTRRDKFLQGPESIDEGTQRLARSLEASRLSRLDERELEAVGRMKKIFLDVRPRTLFRDLQLISAFVSPEVLSEAENAKAFLLTGLAALAFKEDVCRTMLGIADKVVSQDVIKRRMSKQTANTFSLTEAAEFWIICAKEGNAIAQRELATLYLNHPSLLQRVSSPMSLSREIFSDRSGDLDFMTTSADQATTRLALHWMQLAAKNGDQVAEERLHGSKTPSI